MKKYCINLDERKPCPKIKYEHLALAIIGIVIELTLLGLNFYANTGKMAGAPLWLGTIAAYGWLFGFFFLALALEDLLYFWRSLNEYKAWENEEKVRRTIQREIYNAGWREFRSFCEELKSKGFFD